MYWGKTCQEMIKLGARCVGVESDDKVASALHGQ
jgi:hypothetical protein